MKTSKENKGSIFGKNIAGLRKGKHLTQDELAEQMGVTREIISYLEIRAENPTMEQILKFADFFSVSADELLYEESEGINKQGPKSTLQRQFEQLQKLPKSKQKIVSDMIEGVVR